MLLHAALFFGFLSLVTDDSRRLGSVVVTPTPDWKFVTLPSKMPGGGRTLRVEVGAFGGGGRVLADGVVLGAGHHGVPPAAPGGAGGRGVPSGTAGPGSTSK